MYLGHKCMLKPFKSSFNAISKVIFYTLQIISLTFFLNFCLVLRIFLENLNFAFHENDWDNIIWLRSFYSPSRNNLRRRALFPFTAAACKGVGNAPKIKKYEITS